MYVGPSYQLVKEIKMQFKMQFWTCTLDIYKTTSEKKLKVPFVFLSKLITQVILKNCWH